MNGSITKFVNSNTASTSSSSTLSSNTIANPKSDLKAITTQSGVSYDGPQILPSPSSLPKVVENKPEATKDTKRLSLLDLTPTYMTLELADRLISHPIGVAEDVYVKTERALIDVFEGELTLRVGKEAITFTLDQTSRYSANYSDMTAKRIDVIDMACKEYSQEVLGFSDTISSGNPTPYYDSIVFVTSLTLTSFENSDFLLEEVDAFLAIEDEPTSSEFHQSYLDHEGYILLLEVFLNDDPSLPPPNQRNYLPEVRKELKIYSPNPTRVVEGVLQLVAPTTAEQRLARKNELKACSALLMALPDKHQLKINSHKDAKTLMEA
nr:hypothetical protein [Tanacetum cinerariifolium]